MISKNIFSKRYTLGALFAVSIAIPAVATTEHAFTPTAVCNWKDAAGPQPSYLSGITNLSTTALAWLDCGVDAIPSLLTVSGGNVVSTPTPYDLTLHYTDNKLGATAADAINCNLYQCDVNNSACYTAPGPRYSCGGTGTNTGCTTLSSSNAVTGAILWTSVAPVRTTLDCSLPMVEPTNSLRSFMNSITQTY